MVNLSQLALDALEALDLEAAPLGLYACEEFGQRGQSVPRLQPERLRIARAFAAHGCEVPAVRVQPRRWQPSIAKESVSFKLPNGQPAHLQLARTAKVKVRRFGSAYRVDDHVKHSERWTDLRMERELSNLWKPPKFDFERHVLRLLVFIGFAAEARPFERELSSLQSSVECGRHGVSYETRFWGDRFARAFSVRLASWSVSAAEEQATP